MPVINTNVAAIQARGNFDRVQREMDQSIARLSSGKRINSAHDDASGLAISGRMESQIRGLNMNIRNAKDGQSLVDTMEGALQEVSGILQRMRELAVQASSGIGSAADRGYLDTEVEALRNEIDAIAANTTFNETYLFSAASQYSFYTDINLTGTEVVVSANKLDSEGLVFSAEDVTVSTVAHTTSAISIIDDALSIIDTNRAKLGAISNRFDHIIDNLTNVVANTSSAQSRIQDADYAVETTALTRATILQQAATSMIAQANANKNSIMTLIQG
jgi:flagellin